MVFSINHKLVGQSEVWTRHSKEAFLQLLSDIIDDYEFDGATIFNFNLETNLDKKKEN